MKTTASFTIRTMRVGDVIPGHLLGKWEVLLLDCQWVWVLEQDEQIEAVLIAAPTHGILFLLRVAGSSKAPKTWLHAMLRTVLNEALERKLVAAMTYLTDVPSERKLERIAKRAGWLMVRETGYWAMGRTGGY